MQIIQYATKLYTNSENLVKRECSAQLCKIVLKRLTFDKVHDKIPSSVFGEVIVDAR